MEEIGNIKSMRNNVMLVSILVFLLFIFESNISKVNILGLIELQDLQTFKFLITLLVVNIYVLIRYYGYLMKHNFSLNYVLLFKNFIKGINNKKIQGTLTILESENNQLDQINIDQDNNLIYYYQIDNNTVFPKQSGYFKEILSNPEIKATLINNKEIYLTHLGSEKVGIKIVLNKFYIKPFINFYFFDNYISDYYLPILLGFFSILLLIGKLILLQL